MSAEQTIRVGLVDDHNIVREGLRLLVESASDIHCVFSAGDTTEALKVLRTQGIDVMLLDIEMPGMDGITFCAFIKEHHPEVKVIALTMFNEESLIRRMIEAGADGYLLKNTDREELLTAVRRVHDGKSHFSTEISGILLRSRPDVKGQDPLIPSLSAREKQIVRLIMEEHTSSEIAERLNISFNTVETHRRNIMHKLNARNTAGIVRMVMEFDLLERK